MLKIRRLQSKTAENLLCGQKFMMQGPFTSGNSNEEHGFFKKIK